MSSSSVAENRDIRSAALVLHKHIKSWASDSIDSLDQLDMSGLSDSTLKGMLWIFSIPVKQGYTLDGELLYRCYNKAFHVDSDITLFCRQGPCNRVFIEITYYDRFNDTVGLFLKECSRKIIVDEVFERNVL